jgi:PilZ domain
MLAPRRAPTLTSIVTHLYVHFADTSSGRNKIVTGTDDRKATHTNVGGGERSGGIGVETGLKGDRDAAERRTTPRVAFTAEAVAVEPASGTRIDAHTSDLSFGGCYVDTISPFSAGTELQLRLTADRKSVLTTARVAHTQNGVGMGLQFLQAGTTQQSTLRHWVAEIRGEAQPERHVLDDEEQPIHRMTAKTIEHDILEELLVLMLRKGLLPEEEGEAMLRRLLR